MSLADFDPGRSLAGLKDFQRRTVDYVFRRMWEDDPPATRFLVADEVGLGKTMVARGVIARTLEHLKEDVGRIDVAYVCSNAAIAQQNVNRLNILDDDHFSLATRLTLLPLQLHELEKNRVNFVSFTPGTTFDLKSSGGIWKERVLLYRLLSEELPDRAEPLLHVLRNQVSLRRFRRRVREQWQPLNESLGQRFLKRLRQDAAFMSDLDEVCRRFRVPRDEIPPEDRARQLAFIGSCRHTLARVCIDALEPDLVILDEFQRFRDLLDGDDEAALLARSVMDYVTPEGNDVRVLLLSATPYKPLTLGGEDENHYEDFLRTLQFLFGDESKVAQLQEHLQVYRRGLYQSGDPDLPKARQSIETLLRSVMVRTERVGASQHQDAMLTTELEHAPVAPEDLDQARLLDRVAKLVEAGDTVEYWKSAPHLLHFMKDYQLKRRLEDTAEDPPPGLGRAVRAHRKGLLSPGDVDRYRKLSPGNGRLRLLLDEMVEPGQWRLLWVHPSLPYLEPGGAYAQVPQFTKALIFSSWTVVPDAVSAMCSYEVERRMLEESRDRPRYRRLRRDRRPLLRFTQSKGRLTGMPALALMYPSVALQEAVDPLGLSLEVGDGKPAPVAEVRRRAGEAVEARLRETGLWPRAGDGPPDQSWYWAALAILDRPYLTGRRRWMKSARGWRGALAAGEEDKGLTAHIEAFSDAAEGKLDEELGPAPDDLVDVLVDFALGSPAVCTARAMRRIAPGLGPEHPSLSQAAAQVAGGFRTLFNLPETIALLRASDPDVYWHTVLRHGIDGNLQAVLDEYAHQLREGLGVAEHEDEDVVRAVAEQMADVLSLRPARVSADEIKVSRSWALLFKRFRFRTRFALRFGNLRDDRDRTLARVGTVRGGFNSPFRPFVLATTSIGQEGLDFHPYCHAVYHWNLPSNPVDMEQREGRVQRYKGHAVRKNVAKRWGLGALRERMEDGADPWRVLFEAAATDRPPGANELIPYWIYQIDDGASVRRRIPMFPFSREVGKFAALQRRLAIYRLAFGQPRQEDLVEFLEQGVDGEREGAREGARKDVAISLEPPGEEG